MVALFAIWGLSQLVFSVLGVLALTRYRAMIPFMFVLFLLEHLARRLIPLVKPIARTGAPPGLYINIALLVLMIVGLVLSLRRRADLPS
jgi:MYXO-CTERM domain-containing protein